MKFLLDTHILLWALADSRLLSAKARRIIADDANACFYSPVSLAEIAIKHRKHPDEMVLSANEARVAFMTAGYQELPFLARHATMMDDLKQHHADPFDRMLIVQALAEDLRFVSHDDKVAQYGDVVVPV